MDTSCLQGRMRSRGSSTSVSAQASVCSIAFDFSKIEKSLEETMAQRPIPGTPGFRCCDNKGFHITFENGVTVSVQFGKYNYITNRDTQRDGEHSITAEIAAFAKDGSWLTKQLVDEDPGDDVLGWQTPADVFAFMQRAAAWPKE